MRLFASRTREGQGLECGSMKAHPPTVDPEADEKNSSIPKDAKFYSNKDRRGSVMATKCRDAEFNPELLEALKKRDILGRAQFGPPRYTGLQRSHGS